MIHGTKCLEMPIACKETEIDSGSLKPGVYMVTLRDQKSMQTTRLVIR